MTPDRAKVLLEKATQLYSKHEVELAIKSLAKQITTKLAASNPVIVCTLTGGIVLTGKLMMELDFPFQLDYAHLTRYGHETVGGDLQWKAHPTLSVNKQRRTVLIVDDILDKGITLNQLIAYYQSQQVEAVYTAVLVDKMTCRDKQGLLKADFIGLTVPDRYVVGYGLDAEGYLRNASGIFALDSN